jgi:hypothetical protein
MSIEQWALEHINSLERGADREDKQVIDRWMCMQQEGWGAGWGPHPSHRMRWTSMFPEYSDNFW